jgi:hypothetical protein
MAVAPKINALMMESDVNNIAIVRFEILRSKVVIL